MHSVSAGRTIFFATAVCAALWCGGAPADDTSGETADVATAERLAELLRDGRTVVSNNQTLINDPSIGDKHLDGNRFVEEATQLYVDHTGEKPGSPDLSDRDRRLLQAQIDAMREVVDEHQDDINRSGVGFKGFVPALFGRLMNEKFGNMVGEEATVRVTAPQELVRNRKALPDAWETKVIDTVFSDPNRAKKKAYTEQTTVDGRPAFRMLVPEYYTASCLSCHGAPKGAMDITGYPKEGGKLGELGGAISIVLFK